MCPRPHSNHTQKSQGYERYQGHLMGPPTDPGPSGNSPAKSWRMGEPQTKQR
ncbi:unnamed protein product [Staurois parvus]|uniref:Uncharacterized protein n=1 Tax=Staurois parvus TaxID=386267 RepID=A0ABN9DP65_9NEOB|nr:unnamed protein product [Staurois parvus]